MHTPSSHFRYLLLASYWFLFWILLVFNLNPLYLTPKTIPPWAPSCSLTVFLLPFYLCNLAVWVLVPGSCLSGTRNLHKQTYTKVPLCNIPSYAWIPLLLTILSWLLPSPPPHILRKWQGRVLKELYTRQRQTLKLTEQEIIMSSCDFTHATCVYYRWNTPLDSNIQVKLNGSER